MMVGERLLEFWIWLKRSLGMTGTSELSTSELSTSELSTSELSLPQDAGMADTGGPAYDGPIYVANTETLPTNTKLVLVMGIHTGAGTSSKVAELQLAYPDVTVMDGGILGLPVHQHLPSGFQTRPRSVFINRDVVEPERSGAPVFDSPVSDSSVSDSSVSDSSVSGAQSPHIQNSDIQNSDIQDSDMQDADIQDSGMQEPSISDSGISDSGISDSDSRNFGPVIANPEITESEIHNPEISNPEISTPEISTPEISIPEKATSEFPNPESAQSNGDETYREGVHPDLIILMIHPTDSAGTIKPYLQELAGHFSSSKPPIWLRHKPVLPFMYGKDSAIENMVLRLATYCFQDTDADVQKLREFIKTPELTQTPEFIQTKEH